MHHYSYHKRLQEIWTNAIDLYSQGFRDPNFFFNEIKIRFLRSIGSNEKELFDYANDFGRTGEPDFPTVALIQDIRRSYFLEIQGSAQEHSATGQPPLPSPKATCEAFPDLPRIALEVHCKLTGKRGSEIMYPSSTDREFLRKYDIHAAEFLRKVWESDGDSDQLASWIAKRNQASDFTQCRT
ncbi:hypothetical protein [Pelagicoccus sp. SDUM812002]|uniref:hypothetical protein n=1 Tax=Pelagicoccus sp. SDUM812002 TaxID=3041266 RepID=UPI00280C9CA6|nr:hypothetical protein [Pelagicoccus sp. SDUM812002]MDQ8184582.1 hypothetical protein [Pelagicoccus sp. SDUM812002]